MKLIDAQKEQIENLVKLEKRTFRDSWNADIFNYEIVFNPLSKVKVLIDNDVIIGYCDYWFSGEGIEIASIGVDPKYQGMGYASYMMDYIEDEAVRNFAHFITLEVRVSNESAINLYKSKGFKTVTVKKKYYSDNHEDAYYMVKEIQI